MDALVAAGEVAGGNLPPELALQRVVEIAIELLRAEQGSIMLVDGSGRRLHLAAASGLPPSVPRDATVAVGEGVAGRVMATGRGLLLGDVDEHDFVNLVPKTRRISASLVVPLRSRGRAIGVLNLARARGSFPADALAVAQVFADQAGGLIERARLRQRAEERSAGAAALARAGRALLGILDTDRLLRLALDGAIELLGAEAGFACVLDGDGSPATGTFRGLSPETVSALAARAASSRGEDAVRSDVCDNGHLSYGIFHTGGGRAGVVAVVTASPPDPARLELLAAFTGHCGAALGAAELHAALAAKHGEVAAIIRAVPNPIVVADGDARLVALNPAAELAFGVSAAFAAGRPAAGTLGHEGVERLLQGALDDTEVIAGAPLRLYRARAAQIRLAAPQRPGRVVILDDVTAERETARLQNDFVSVVSHELRTPLTSIKGFARLLVQRGDALSPEQRMEAHAAIDSKAAELERLIEDILHLSGIESGTSPLVVEDVDVAAVVGDAVEQGQRRHPGRAVRVEAPAELRWPCDAVKVATILRHLIDNALAYSSAPEEVVVRVRAGDELRIDVVDRGIGILSEDIPTIFERFRQLEGAHNRTRGGMGLGLYLCRQLAALHGGTLRADSAWGKGSTFTVTLPRSVPVAPPPGANATRA